MTNTTQPVTEAMKPCPFCGHQHIDFDTEPNGVVFSIWCPSCSASMDHSITGAHVDLVERWNTRALAAAPAGEVELVRDDAFEERIVSMYRFQSTEDRDRAKEAIALGVYRYKLGKNPPQEPAARPDAVAEVLGENFDDFISEAHVHADDMPCVIQRDYLRIALRKLEAIRALAARDGGA